MLRIKASPSLIAISLVAAAGLMPVAAAGSAATVRTVPAASPARTVPAAFPGAEAPELASPGAYRVGTQAISVSVTARPALGSGGLTSSTATLGVRLFYPAAATGGKPAVYRHPINLPKVAPFYVVEQGAAIEQAAPLARGSFPLVLVSHGLGGWSTHFSRICETLASHGYVVASIDHGDERFEDVPGFLRSFGNVLMDRQADQYAAIVQMTGRQPAAGDPIALIDPSAPIGLIGYSMGGYGALGTAGARYDSGAKAFAGLPAEARARLAAGNEAIAAKIGALVLMAPWGAQPDNRVWSADAVASVLAPTLLIAGDRDDVVNYAGGVRWLFDKMRGTNRRLLTLRGAKHNVAGNWVDLPKSASADLLGYFREPVWRQERLNQINAHFIVAFFDQALKHDASAAAYLDVPTERSDDGQWPVTFGEQTGGKLAGAAQPNYWRGFPRGWASGMELTSKAKGE